MIIKKSPEDFVVTEKTKLNLNPAGRYSYFLMEKKNITTLDAARQVSRHLNVPLRLVNYAGTKDKHAITKQAISVYGCKERNDLVISENLKIYYIGQGNERLNLGDLEGNYFTIKRYLGRRECRLLSQPE